jgi:large subunit ribosomal protein L24
MRSFAGPFRGRGFLAAGGIGYAYNVSTGRYGDDGIRIRLGLETAERPEIMEAEGLLSFNRAAPRFEGMVVLSRPAGTVLATGKAVAHEPWKLSAKVKSGAKWAALSEIVFQYGPHEWGTSLMGSAQFRFGERPRIDGELRARQLDLDRMLATVDAPRRSPLPAVQALSEMLGSALRPPWPVALGIHIDAVTLSGAPVQAVGANLRLEGSRWHLDRLEFRAPGLTAVKLKGILEPLGKAFRFAGDVNIDAGDSRTLVAWLTGQPATATQVRPWHIAGAITLGGDRIALENLRAEFDRATVAGRVAYFWPTGIRPARLDAELRAGEIDFDALVGLGDGVLNGIGLEWPREAALALEIDRARIAGLDARGATARLKLNGNGLAVERLSIADFGGAKLSASGHIQTALPQGGNVTVDLDARELAGLIALAETFAPGLAEPLRRIGRNNPAKLRAGVSLANAANGDTRGTFDLSGRIGAVRISIAAGAIGRPGSFLLTDPTALDDTDKSIDARLEADDGAALLGLLGLDRVAIGDPHPGRLILNISGPRRGDFRVAGTLLAGPVDADVKGTLRFGPEQFATLDLDQLSGTVGGHRVRGKLALGFGDSPRIDGALQAETLDARAMIAAAMGLPMPRGGGEDWSSAPFAIGAVDVAGRIEFKAQRATIFETAVARQLHGVARFGPTEVVFENVTGEFADGRIEGRLAFAGGPAGLSARFEVKLTGAEAGALFAQDGPSPIAGRINLQAELAGNGRSPAAFFGSLSGNGNIKLEAARFAGLNPRVFDIVVRAAELGMPSEGHRLHEFAIGVLNDGWLQIAKAEAAIDVAAGQARFSNIVLRGADADLEVTANIDLAANMLDALLTLSGLPASDGAARPLLLVAFRGALPAPTRTVDTGLLAGWLTLRAVDQQSQQIDAMERANPERIAPRRPALPLSSPPISPETTSSTPNEQLSIDQTSRPPDVPTTAQQPPGAPRAEGAPPLAPSAPARTVIRPPGLFGAQN